MDQLGFDALLAEAATDNEARLFDRQAAHLPRDMTDAIPFYRALLDDHHAAMIAADLDRVTALREDACNLAIRLNGGTSMGIIGGEDAPGCVLARETAAASGAIPLWGQDGDFIINVRGVAVRIEMNGLFGIASRTHWLGFSAHAVAKDRPFISPTGYRSFLGCQAAIEPNITPDASCARFIEAHIVRDLGGRLVEIAKSARISEAEQKLVKSG